MRHLVLIAFVLAAGCSGSKTPTPTAPANSLGTPGIEGPSHDFQADSTRPQLVIRNSAGTGAGRSYEVQVATTTAFTSIAWSKTVPEDGSGRTVVNVDQDLSPQTPYHWRARLVAGGQSSEWSVAAAFRTGAAGYNRPGELFDALTSGSTVGTTSGPVSFIPGRGARLETQNSYIRYALPETVSSGEFSMFVEGISANGPTHKLKIFSMSDGPGDFIASRWEASAHYRGLGGNPDNAISLKVVWGTDSNILEPDFGTRAASVVNLNAGSTYFWQGLWGANFGRFGSDAGTWPGMIVRDVWLGRTGRPGSIK